jgi:hypothetical protein
MKKYILLLSLFASFSCEDKDSDGSQMVGLWKMSSFGEYENANCTGQIRSEDLGTTVFTMELKSGGTGNLTSSDTGGVYSLPITWNESKSEICPGITINECVQFKLKDNKFTFEDENPGVCQDVDGNFLSEYDESNCENNSNRYWNPPICQWAEFIKQ